MHGLKRQPAVYWFGYRLTFPLSIINQLAYMTDLLVGLLMVTLLYTNNVSMVTLVSLLYTNSMVNRIAKWWAKAFEETEELIATSAHTDAQQNL